MSDLEIPAAVREYLIGGRAALIATLEPDGSPYTSVVGSSLMMPDGRIRFAAWGTGRTLGDIKTSRTACVVTLGDDLVWAMQGPAEVLKDPMDNSSFPPHPYAMVEITPRIARDVRGDRRTSAFVHMYSGRGVEERLARRDAMIAEMRAFQRIKP